MFLAGLILLPVILRWVTAVQHPEVTEYYWFFRIFRSPFHVSFDGLAVGVFCAFLYRDRAVLSDATRSFWARRLFWLSAALLIWQLFFGELLDHFGWYQKILQPLILSLGFGGLLLSVACGGAKGCFLRSHWLLIIARISYPLYLIHIAFVPLALVLSGITFGTGWSEVLQYFSIYLALSMVAGFLLHFSVEKPFLVLKDLIWKPINPATFTGELEALH